MHWYNYLALAAASVAAIGNLTERRWIMAAAFACMAAYQLFGKWLPEVLPGDVADLFSIAALGLIVLDVVLRRRRAAAAAAG